MATIAMSSWPEGSMRAEPAGRRRWDHAVRRRRPGWCAGVSFGVHGELQNDSAIILVTSPCGGAAYGMDLSISGGGVNDSEEYVVRGGAGEINVVSSGVERSTSITCTGTPGAGSRVPAARGGQPPYGGGRWGMTLVCAVCPGLFRRGPGQR
jgi:hypothetical protein